MVTTHNQIYMWFRSDHSVNGQGFEFVWNTIDPGTISCLKYHIESLVEALNRYSVWRRGLYVDVWYGKLAWLSGPLSSQSRLYLVAYSATWQTNSVYIRHPSIGASCQL